MSEDINNQNDNGSCIKSMKSLMDLSREISATSNQLRISLKRVQDNFKLTGGLLLEGKEGVVYKGKLWRWKISSNLLFVVVDHEISSVDNIPREVIVKLIKVLPDFLTQVQYAYFNLKKSLYGAECSLKTIDSDLEEVCAVCGQRSLSMTEVQEVIGLYLYCPDCLLKASDRGDIIQVDKKQKIGDLYIPKGTYVELALVSRLEWGE